ncbi:protein TIC 20-II, chloroplastic [Canna indica]|uniref:Protein TIC 20 n=1 Tax=Canna indica TaxID=4628 RepID=A0AAQ3QN99_9LILI|nr:protein TIC 20-II, chloroplastic [Canna indica]
MASLTLLRFSPPPRFPRVPTPSPPATSLRLCLRPSLPVRRSTTVCMVRSPVPASDRLISALAYTLPFIDSLHYVSFLFARVPAAAATIAPILPLAAAYRSVPYAAFVAFFALYLGVVRNPSLSRYVRFNSMQAVVLDVLLALPALFQRVFGTPSRGVGFRVMEMGYHAIFAFSFACFVYSMFSCVLGRTPNLPIVAAAADRQL